jgi:hypothetical protein
VFFFILGGGGALLFPLSPGIPTNFLRLLVHHGGEVRFKILFLKLAHFVKGYWCNMLRMLCFVLFLIKIWVFTMLKRRDDILTHALHIFIINLMDFTATFVEVNDL